jgi:hypothetical protein
MIKHTFTVTAVRVFKERVLRKEFGPTRGELRREMA